MKISTQALMTKYASNLALCRGNIDRNWQKLTQQPEDQQAQDSLERDIHNVAGSGANFGFDMLSDLACALAQTLSESRLTDTRQLKYIAGEIDQLLAVMDQAIEDATEQSTQSPAPLQKQAGTTHTLTGSTNNHTEIPHPRASKENVLFENSERPNNTLSQNTTDATGAETKPQGQKLYMSEHPRTIPQLIRDNSTLPHEKKVVYIVEDDESLADYLLNELTPFHYEVQIIPDLHTLNSIMQDCAPNVAVVDVRMPDGKTTDYFKKVKENYPDLPLIFTSAIDDIRSRVAAVEAGGQYFLKKPVEVNRLVQLIDRIVQPHADDPVRVMIVPNDNSVGTQIAAVLANASCIVEIVDNPWRLLNSAEKFLPDMILLSTQYKDCNGHVLAEALRQEDDFISTPLMFITDNDDPEDIRKEGSLGCDGFLHDPAEAEQLVAEVLSKARHHRQLIDIIARDNLTGAYTHGAIIRQVHRDFHQAQQNDQDFSVAIIDIDNFRSINDRYGHKVGDRLLCSLTHFLRKHVDKDANIGRYGGEEFLISMPKTSGDKAFKHIDMLRQAFSENSQVTHAGVNNTFSAGVAAFPTYDSVSELLYYADQALYEAQRTGKNKALHM